MCGICGKLNFDRHAPVDEAILRPMMAAMRHRGPDGEGIYRSGPVGLGHVRLSIIDLEYGAQPIANEDGTIWIVFTPLRISRGPGRRPMRRSATLRSSLDRAAGTDLGLQAAIFPRVLVRSRRSRRASSGAAAAAGNTTSPTTFGSRQAERTVVAVHAASSWFGSIDRRMFSQKVRDKANPAEPSPSADARSRPTSRGSSKGDRSSATSQQVESPTSASI